VITTDYTRIGQVAICDKPIIMNPRLRENAL